MQKRKVLILNGQYLPGYKGGGPIQSCANLVENLYEYCDFYVLCADRDFKSDKPYDNIKVNDWNEVGHANVYYMSPDKQNLGEFKKVINEVEYDVLYLNGFFSPIFTIKPLILRKIKKLKNNNFILSPRGDFTGGCENKKFKKYSYIFFAKLFGLYRNIKWHATSDIEKRDILKKFPKSDVINIPNLPVKFVKRTAITSKVKGDLKLVFISRIFPKKNLKFALEILQKVKNGNIAFDIYGPMEDKDYWNECEELIENMPSNIKVSYCGEVEHNKIPYIFEKYHFFFFPTLGENYGHVIVEAMMNNCLCLLSKGVTPWDDYLELLKLGANLDNKEDFIKIIERLVIIDQKEFNRLLKLNNDYISNINEKSINENIDNYKKLLENVGK